MARLQGLRLIFDGKNTKNKVNIWKQEYKEWG